LSGRERLERHPFVEAGLVEVQDEGSQIAALLLEAEPGQQILDLCAGAGGKALALAGQMLNRGQIYATDAARRRLDAARPRLDRAGARNVQLRAIRSEEDPWLDQFRDRLDRVLVDAPCTGVGRWRREPDARWRLTPDDLARATALQARLLDAASRLVKPGGRLVYVVCSPLPAEGERQIEAFLERRPDFAPLAAADAWRRTLAGEPPQDASPWLLLSPARTKTDGFFAAILHRA
jgi:16S rRNA (cytosine967-C5)-methyltransferase